MLRSIDTRRPEKGALGDPYVRVWSNGINILEGGYPSSIAVKGGQRDRSGRTRVKSVAAWETKYGDETKR